MLDLDKHPDTEVSLVELAVSQWFYWVEFAGADSDKYQKVLVPLDMTEGAEGVLPKAEKLLRLTGEGILLHVIQTSSEGAAKTGRIQSGFGGRDSDRAKAMQYLTELAGQLNADSNRWQCDVIEAPSIVHGVVAYAAREGVDVIVTSDHQRKGLAKLTRRSIAKEIKQKAPVNVRIFPSGELVLK